MFVLNEVHDKSTRNCACANELDKDGFFWGYNSGGMKRDW